jgi:hypothetical protein
MDNPYNKTVSPRIGRTEYFQGRNFILINGRNQLPINQLRRFWRPYGKVSFLGGKKILNNQEFK